MKITRLFLFLIILCAPVLPTPLIMRGVVCEVRDGRSIVIDTHNRKLNVVLRGVDAPELQQDFGDRSREHLASLILNKSVAIDFSQLKGQHVVGKVILEGRDIGLQTIRDGSAWMDRRPLELNESETAIYDAAEQAARNEMRGLWEEGTPMPPWEWRRIQASKLTPHVTTGYKNGGARTLGREDLLFSARPAMSAGGTTGVNASLPKPTAKPFNMSGQDADFRPYLRSGRVTIVYFYADWCPSCRRLTPVMEQVNAKLPDMQVVFMDIGSWQTPVTAQYGITSVPHLKIFDKTGNLAAEGREARSWLEEWLSK